LALTRIPGIGDVNAKKLISRFGDPKSVFEAGRPALIRAEMHDRQIDAILQFCGWPELRQELAMLEQRGIRILFYTEPDYPHRLLSTPDFPPLLYYRGAANLNAQRVISVVGTRSPTDYGKQVTEQIIRELAQPDCLIVSGLAFGIDAAAHNAALQYQVPTIGVLGHGLAYTYPREHTALASSIRQDGGLLTSFDYNAKAEHFSFPIRNGLVAGLCDALIVVETGEKGGSLNTVNKALEYKRRVFAVPGRVTDNKSRGCLRLIAEGNADLLVSGGQLMAAMSWQWPAGRSGVQAALPFATGATTASSFASTEPHSPPLASAAPPPALLATATGRPDPEHQLVALLQEKDSLSIDELTTLSRLDTPSVAISLLNLEIQGLIRPLPGQRYRLAR
jgi:DNA processing protein